jgi:hypothetical protein
MDPMSIQGAASTGWTRPVGPSPADVPQALREGRIFSGDVLQTFDGGSVLIGVGRLRVPAFSHAELQPGRRYMFEVVAGGATLELKLVGAAPDAPQGLVQALRQALGVDAPLGALLEQLTRALAAEVERARAGGAESPSTELERWLADFEAHAFKPGDEPAVLRQRLRDAGLTFEARLAELVLDAAPSGERRRLGAELVAALSEQLRAAGSTDDAAGLLQRLGLALEAALQLVGTSPPAEAARAPSEAPHNAFGRALEAALAALSTPDARQVSAALARLDHEHWPRWMKLLLVRALAPGAAQEGAAAGRGLDAALAALDGDLKAQLLRAEERLGPSQLRAALERALGGLEAEQLLNVARASVDEPPQWSLPIHEGGRWTTLHLSVARDGAAGGHSGGGAPRRVALEVEFSASGPVHVDLLLGEGGAVARVLVQDERIAQFFTARLGALEQALAFGGKAAHASVARASDTALHTDSPARSSFFESRTLLDLEG